MYVCVYYGSENIQPLLSSRKVTYWFS